MRVGLFDSVKIVAVDAERFDRKYLVHHRFDDGEFCVSLKNASEIIDRVDMQDCTGEELEVYESTGFGEIIKLSVRGTWHDPDRPLYIAAVRPDGSIAFDGYGTDH